MTPEQEKLALRLLCNLADGCSFAVGRPWQFDDCAKDNGRGFACAPCEARQFLESLGFAMNKAGHWDPPQGIK